MVCGGVWWYGGVWWCVVVCGGGGGEEGGGEGGVEGGEGGEGCGGLWWVVVGCGGLWWVVVVVVVVVRTLCLCDVSVHATQQSCNELGGLPLGLQRLGCEEGECGSISRLACRPRQRV